MVILCHSSLVLVPSSLFFVQTIASRNISSKVAVKFNLHLLASLCHLPRLQNTSYFRGCDAFSPLYNPWTVSGVTATYTSHKIPFRFSRINVISFFRENTLIMSTAHFASCNHIIRLSIYYFIFLPSFLPQPFLFGLTPLPWQDV